MINARDATLDQAPKPVDGVGVNIPINVNASGMMNTLVLIAFAAKLVVRGKFIGVDGSRWESPVGNRLTFPTKSGRSEKEVSRLRPREGANHVNEAEVQRRV